MNYSWKNSSKIIPDIEEGFEIISHNLMVLAITSIYYNHCQESRPVNQHTPLHNAKIDGMWTWHTFPLHFGYIANHSH
jgi:hypothetical protein